MNDLQKQLTLHHVWQQDWSRRTFLKCSPAKSFVYGVGNQR